uniref:Uncharacterized protein n=1 Tax=Heterosigma akashiwo TaxID=2829 RepID=A0A7S3Y1K1_HETAK|mmetsp:Transcript_39481/g.68857  ORF Transcript_39481/g.68857 Transcript_39481/m.68857 type:complete len:107 (+) Transcript_39481:2-322(+)
MRVALREAEAVHQQLLQRRIESLEVEEQIALTRSRENISAVSASIGAFDMHGYMRDRITLPVHEGQKIQDCDEFDLVVKRIQKKGAVLAKKSARRRKEANLIKAYG